MSSNVRLVNTQQAIQMLGCSKHAFKGYIARGKIYPCKKESGRSFFSEESIKNFCHPSKESSTSVSRRFPHKKSSVPTEMTDVIQKWKTSPQDSGSADVQIGIYTEKIEQLELDMKGVRHDDPVFAKMRSLLIKHVFERRRLLNYLQNSDHVRYRRAMEFINADRKAS